MKPNTMTTTQSPNEPQSIADKNYEKAVRYLKEGNDLFLTGAGGTGKSYTSRKIVKEFKNPIVLGTTGLAAVNIGGETMHSFFRLGINSSLEDLQANDKRFVSSFASQRRLNYEHAYTIIFSKLEDILNNADLILLDEVSMATSNQLEMMLYRIQKLAPGRTIPFLFVGDLLQLPPIGQETPIFESPFWKAKTWTLKKIHRTSDKDFYDIQRKVRWGIADKQVIDFIEARQTNNIMDDSKIMLASTNKVVDAHNIRAMKELDTEEESYKMGIESKDTVKPVQIDKFLQDLPVSETLTLKVGARVMITTNVYITDLFTGSKRLAYYNGQVGTYTGLVTDELGIKKLKVVADTGHTLLVERFAFEKTSHVAVGDKVETVVEISAKQFPVRLAYALTIHKSQGQTLDAVHISCRGINNPGQFYVALSRCSNPDKLSFSNFHARTHIYADDRCKAFYGKP